MTSPALVMVDIESGTFQLADPAQPQLRVDDLAPVRGDGIFEALSVRRGVIHGFDDHMARLGRSARAMDLPEPDVELWRRAVSAVIAAHDECDELVVRYIISRGDDATGKPTAWAYASPTPQHSIDERTAGIDVLLLERGYDTGTAARAPWLLLGAKTLSYAVNMAAGRYAKAHGADEIVFTAPDGTLLEAPTSTVVIADGDTLRTPDPKLGILFGTTQLELFRRAPELGLNVEYGLFTKEDLLAADAVWVVSSVRLLSPVNSVDGTPLRRNDDLGAKLLALLD